MAATDVSKCINYRAERHRERERVVAGWVAAIEPKNRLGPLIRQLGYVELSCIAHSGPGKSACVVDLDKLDLILAEDSPLVFVPAVGLTGRFPHYDWHGYRYTFEALTFNVISGIPYFGLAVAITAGGKFVSRRGYTVRELRDELCLPAPPVEVAVPKQGGQPCPYSGDTRRAVGGL